MLAHNHVMALRPADVSDECKRLLPRTMQLSTCHMVTRCVCVICVKHTPASPSRKANRIKQKHKHKHMETQKHRHDHEAGTKMAATLDDGCCAAEVDVAQWAFK